MIAEPSQLDWPAYPSSSGVVYGQQLARRRGGVAGRRARAGKRDAAVTLTRTEWRDIGGSFITHSGIMPSAGKPLANTVSDCEANDQSDCSFQHGISD
jgi:hypothetical protein